MLSKDRRKWRNLLLLFGALALSFHTGACYGQDKPNDVKRLLKERRDLLSEAVDVMTKVCLELHRLPLQELVQAERDSLKADLDWFDKPEDRIKAINEHKEAADSILKRAKVRVNSGRDAELVLLHARAYVLEVQLEVLKEKQRQKAKPGK